MIRQVFRFVDLRYQLQVIDALADSDLRLVPVDDPRKAMAEVLPLRCDPEKIPELNKYLHALKTLSLICKI